MNPLAATGQLDAQGRSLVPNQRIDTQGGALLREAPPIMGLAASACTDWASWARCSECRGMSITIEEERPWPERIPATNGISESRCTPLGDGAEVVKTAASRLILLLAAGVFGGCCSGSSCMCKNKSPYDTSHSTMTQPAVQTVKQAEYRAPPAQ